MRRKVVQQGAATMMVSLPAQWVKKNNIEKGDEIVIENLKEDLLISTSEKKAVRKEIEISIDNKVETSIRTILTNLYRTGYDRILVKANSKDVFLEIEKILQSNLLGFQVIEKTENSCIIENLTEPSEIKVENLMNKIFFNIDWLFDMLESSVDDVPEDSSTVEVQIQSLDNFCRRILFDSVSKDKSILQWVFHSELIHAQRELHHLCVYLRENKMKLDDDYLEIVRDIREIFNNIRTAYMKNDFNALQNVHEIYDNSKKSDTNDNEIYYRLESAKRGFYLSSSPLFGLISVKN